MGFCSSNLKSSESPARRGSVGRCFDSLRNSHHPCRREMPIFAIIFLRIKRWRINTTSPTAKQATQSPLSNPQVTDLFDFHLCRSVSLQPTCWAKTPRFRLPGSYLDIQQVYAKVSSDVSFARHNSVCSRTAHATAIQPTPPPPSANKAQGQRDFKRILWNKENKNQWHYIIQSVPSFAHKSSFVQLRKLWTVSP